MSPAIATRAAARSWCRNELARFDHGSRTCGRTTASLQAWYTGEANAVERLRQENAELRKALAACEAKQRKR